MSDYEAEAETEGLGRLTERAPNSAKCCMLEQNKIFVTGECTERPENVISK